MDFEKIKKALIPGIPAAIGAWFIYGIISSFFDDTVFEQMFEPAGIIFFLVMAVFGVGFFYFRNEKKEQAEAEAQNKVTEPKANAGNIN